MARKKTAGKRYTAEEKEVILSFVDEVNQSKGRGGPAAAKKKFGVSPITLTSWQKKRSGGGAQTQAKKAGNSKNPLRRMARILDEIDTAEKELLALKKEYAKLRKKI
ncbi:hypothetical protein AAFN60_19050 [Roseibacillus persicicus]|uniref:hypothetical protein n=1 Tax=Roseibacillus persicicus TaxID=454148 RepID=UPI00398ADDBB